MPHPMQRPQCGGPSWSRCLQVCIAGRPIPWARRVITKDGRDINPQRYREWKKRATSIILRQWLIVGLRPLRALRGSVQVEVLALWKCPKRRPKGWIGDWTPDVRQWRPFDPDQDNVMKAVCDALEKAKVVHDDCTIVASCMSKQYGARGEEPGVWVRVYRWVEPRGSDE